MFEDYYMPQFDMDYFNSPAFQQAIASAVQQYSPQPVEPVYYAPEPVYYAPARGIGRRGEYVDDIYDVQPAEEVYVNQGPSAEEIAAAQAEAQRVAAEQEYFARVEAERVAAERAAAAEAAAQRQQTELNERRAQAAQAAVERAAQERAFAEQVAAQAAAEAQAAAQAQVQAEQARVQAEQAAAVAPAPEPVAGIGRRGGEDYYQTEFKIPDVYAPQPEPVYYAPEPEIYRGIGDGLERNFYDADRRYPAEDIYIPAVEPVTIEAEPVRAPAVEPMTIEAEPVAGIGSPAVAAAEAPSLIETAVAAMAAGQGLTQEQYDALADRRIAANTPPPGTSIVGPYAGKKGLSFGDDNTFDIYDEQEVRVVDGKGNVIFSGVGVEGAKQAVAVAQSISDDLGGNANFKIQKGERTIVDGSVGPNRYIDVAYAAPSQSGLGFLADTVLPFAASFIPVIGPIAGAALGSAASSAAQGRSLEDTLTRAAIAAGTAGAVKATGLDTAIGGALSTTGGQAAGQVAGKVAEQAVGGAGDIIVSGLSQALQSAGGALGSAALSQAANAGLSEVTGYKPPAEKFAEQPLPEALQPPAPISVEDAIVVSGIRTPPAADAVTGIGGSVVADAIGGFETPAERFVEEPLPEELVSDTQPPAEDTIVVSGTRATPVADAVTSAISGIGDSILTPDDLSVLDRVSDIEKEVEEPYEEIVVTGRDTAVPIVTPDIGIGGGSVTETLPALTPDPALTDPKSTLDKIIDAAEVAGNVIPIVGGVIGGSGGGGGTIAPDTSKINFTKTTLRPTIPVGGIGGVGGYPYTPQTYGRRGGDQETEYLFFTKDPVTGQELLQSAPAPITTPASNEPAGPAMILPSGNTFAEGGEVDDDMVKHLVDYHKNGGHQGPGRVKGIGSGQDDKIPAYLSDGEYVWSAQDVADLGDGSTDEGVRRLDKMRQMVRRQAGRKDVKKIAKPQKGIDTMLKAVGGLA